MRQLFERIAEAFNKSDKDVNFIDTLIMIATIFAIIILLDLLIWISYNIWEKISYAVYWRINNRRKIIKENKEKENENDCN